jgi:predicted ABC-class ATPase
MAGEDELRRILRRIDGRGYKSYRDVRGAFDLGDVRIEIDRAQADPFAAPSLLRMSVGMQDAQLPAALFAGRVRRIAFADFLARRVEHAIRASASEPRGSGHSGEISVDAGGQEVLERTAIALDSQRVEVRLEVGLPAAGRRVLGRAVESLLCGVLPGIVRQSLFWSALPQAAATAFVEHVENQEDLRAQLPGRGLLAFVGDGAILPRESGASDCPLARERSVPFESPDSLRVTLDLTNPIDGDGGRRTKVSGMGIPEGVTLIVGGGYHGKSTLLRALERGIHPHIPGDGREWVVSRSDLVKIRAEDGRRVECVGIDAFIRELPGGRSTAAFASEDASGSTSQASNIVEALEAGASGLLLDEDTSATNFLVRDARMQALVSRDHEPITPFVERVHELYGTLGTSTVLVMGGSGDYFDVADRVVRMCDYRVEDVTREAHEIAARQPTGRRSEATSRLVPVSQRIPLAASFDPALGRKAVKIDTFGLGEIRFGRETIDLRSVEQLVDCSQTRAIAAALHLAAQRFMNGDTTLSEILDRLDALFDEAGLDVLDPFHRPGRHPGRFARPRRFEIAAAINRIRSLRVKAKGSSS